MTSTTTDNSRSTGFRYNPEAARSAQHNARASAARSAYAAAIKNLAPEYIRDESAFHVQYDNCVLELGKDLEREVSARLKAGTFTWEWAATRGIHRVTKRDDWAAILARSPHPTTNNPAFHAEHLMNFLLSDLSLCSPIARLVATYYASFFTPYKGSLHPEYFRVAISLGITEQEYLDALQEIKEAHSVVTPVRSARVVASGHWLRVNMDAEERIHAWLRSERAAGMTKQFDIKRRTLIKYNIRYSGIQDHMTQLLSTILACRVPLTPYNVEGFRAEPYAVSHKWVAAALGVSREEAVRVLRNLGAVSELWDVAEGNGGAWVSISDEGEAAYKEYYPFVYYTGKEARKRGLDETKHYERRMRRRRGITDAWVGTSSEWRKGDDREEWEIPPHQAPEADGVYGGTPKTKWFYVYEILDPITREIIYVGLTSRRLDMRLLEHMDRPEITVSETLGDPKREHNPLMAERLKLYAALGLEPIIRKRVVVRGFREAHRIEGERIRELEAQGVELLNLEHSTIRPDKEWRKQQREAKKLRSA